MHDETTKKMTAAGKRRKNVLGKGLGALIPGGESPIVQKGFGARDAEPIDYFQCDIDLIQPNRYQPRRRFSEEELAELSRSIREQGILQPLVVRKNAVGYELVAGERRLRAARMAELDKVPVILKDVDDTTMLVLSLVENIQRRDLNPIEESDAYHRLMNEFGMTQEEVADCVGKSRSAIANFLRLRHLPDDIRSSISDGAFSLGHAKVLLGTDSTAQQREIWRQVMEKGLSVRETERLMKRLKAETPPPDAPGPKPKSESIFYNDVSQDLSRRFGTKVQIKRRGKKGKVEIEFYNDEDLDRLLGLLRTEEA